MVSAEPRRSSSAPAVVVASDAVERLAAAAPPDVLVVMDANTRRAVGDRLVAAIGRPATLIFDPVDLHPGLDEAARVKAELDGVAVVIAVGSGVITDIVRYAAHAADRDFISFATAASMDGYSSGVAAMQTQGVKVTYPARPPIAVYADPDVLAAAPRELTRAGIGDLLGKATAGVDWLAAHLLYGERYDATIAADTRRAMLQTAALVPALIAGDAQAQRELIACLIDSGMAIQRFGNSRPASGCEHHMSHFWDLLAARGLRAQGSHGEQVGYATALCMSLQQAAFGPNSPAPRAPVPVDGPLGPDARHWLGEPSEELRAAVDSKQRQLGKTPLEWPSTRERWREFRADLRDATDTYPGVAKALVEAGFTSAQDSTCSTEASSALAQAPVGLDRSTLKATILFATRLRDRYTALDYLEGQGRLEPLAVELSAAPSTSGSTRQDRRSDGP